MGVLEAMCLRCANQPARQEIQTPNVCIIRNNLPLFVCSPGTLSLADVALMWLIRTVLTVRVQVDGPTAIRHLTNELNNKTMVKLILDSRFNGTSLCNNDTGITSLVRGGALVTSNRGYYVYICTPGSI